MKNFVLEPVPNSALLRIAYEGGGEIPDMLKGWYTNEKEAKIAISAWQAENPEKEDVKLVHKERKADIPATKGVEFKDIRE